MSSTGALTPSINSADPVPRPRESPLQGGQACLSGGTPMGILTVGLPILLLVWEPYFIPWARLHRISSYADKIPCQAPQRCLATQSPDTAAS